MEFLTLAWKYYVCTFNAISHSLCKPPKFIFERAYPDSFSGTLISCLYCMISLVFRFVIALHMSVSPAAAHTCCSDSCIVCECRLYRAAPFDCMRTLGDMRASVGIRWGVRSMWWLVGEGENEGVGVGEDCCCWMTFDGWGSGADVAIS